MNWIKVLTILNTADIFGEPEMGYGVAFTPSAFEQEMIRRDSDLRSELEAKWEKDGRTRILYAGRKRPAALGFDSAKTECSLSHQPARSPIEGNGSCVSCTKHRPTSPDPVSCTKPHRTWFQA
jgi:hypothetical protein